MLFIALSLTVLSLVRRFGQKRLLNVNVKMSEYLERQVSQFTRLSMTSSLQMLVTMLGT